MAQNSGIWKQCPCGRYSNCKIEHGTWSWRISAGRDPQTGKRRYNGGTGLPTRGDAVAARKKAAAALVEGKFADDQGYTLGTYLDYWFKTMEERPDPPEKKTLDMHRTNVKTWKAESGLADVRLGKLRKRQFNTAFAHLGRVRTDADRPTSGRYGRWVAQRSHATLLRYKATVSLALSDAVEDELIPFNPVAGKMKSLKIKNATIVNPWEDVPVWTLKQNRTFIDGIAGHPREELYLAYMFTGCRRAELLGAEKIKLNELGTRLKIKTTAVPSTGVHPCCICGGTHERIHIKPGPKGKRSKRWVTLPRFVQSALDRQEDKVAKQKQEFGEGYAEHGLIFPGPDGIAYDGDDITEEFQAICAALDLPIVGGLHFLRHNAVSLLIQTGMKIEQVAINTGHDVLTLRQTYAHLLEDVNAEYVERAVSLVIGSGSGPSGTPSDGGRQQVGSKSILPAAAAEVIGIETRRSEAV